MGLPPLQGHRAPAVLQRRAEEQLDAARRVRHDVLQDVGRGGGERGGGGERALYGCQVYAVVEDLPLAVVQDGVRFLGRFLLGSLVDRPTFRNKK